jgi:hypothetical protein
LTFEDVQGILIYQFEEGIIRTGILEGSMVDVRVTDAEGVVAFAYGTPPYLVTNQWIANMAEDKARGNIGGYIYTQPDIVIQAPWAAVTRLPEKPGKPSPTWRIARGAAMWAKELGLTKLWIACARPHAWRCERDLRMALREIGHEAVASFCPEVFERPEEVWFRLESTQDRTTTQEKWEQRENLLKKLPVWI